MYERTCIRYVYVQTKSAIDTSDEMCDPETSLDTVLECAGTICSHSYSHSYAYYSSPDFFIQSESSSVNFLVFS